MYCILVTGIPAAGKSTIAKYISESLDLTIISKDEIKELLFDDAHYPKDVGVLIPEMNLLISQM